MNKRPWDILDIKWISSQIPNHFAPGHENEIQELLGLRVACPLGGGSYPRLLVGHLQQGAGVFIHCLEIQKQKRLNHWGWWFRWRWVVFNVVVRGVCGWVPRTHWNGPLAPEIENLHLETSIMYSVVSHANFWYLSSQVETTPNGMNLAGLYSIWGRWFVLGDKHAYLPQWPRRMTLEFCEEEEGWCPLWRHTGLPPLTAFSTILIALISPLHWCWNSILFALGCKVSSVCSWIVRTEPCCNSSSKVRYQCLGYSCTTIPFEE